MTDRSAVSNATLRAALDRSGALTPARAVAVISQIAAVLDAAAASQAVRQDVVDPANIVLAADDVAYLADADGSAIEAGTSIEGLAYLAPERLTRNAPVSAATDVYALACVLFECLTGVPPYPHADDLSAIVAAHTGFPIPRPSQAMPSIPAGFDEVIARGLVKDPAGRYASAGALAAAARQALGTVRSAQSEPPESVFVLDAQVTAVPTVASPPRFPQNTGRLHQKRRGRRIAVVAAAVSVVIVATMVVAGAVILRSFYLEQRRAQLTPIQLPATQASDRQAEIYRADSYLRGVAVDVAGNVYVTEARGHRGVTKLDASSMTPSTLPVVGLENLGDLASVTVDGAGNIYVTGSGGRVAMFAPDSTSWTELPFSGLNRPRGLAVDEEGNIYTVNFDGSRGWVVMLTPGATTWTDLRFPDVNYPKGLALDSDGNIFVVDYDSSGSVVKLIPDTVGSTRLPFTGVGDPTAVAVGVSGNVYLASSIGNAGSVAVLKPGSANPTTLAFTGLAHTTGVAVDNSGNIYVTDGPTPTANVMPMGRVIKLATG